MQLKIKRLGAYIIDIIIISIVASLISNISFINPKLKDYKKDYNNYLKISEKYQEKKITSKEYTKKILNYSYYLEKDAIITSIISLSLMLLYFVFFQWWQNGQTFGKKFMKLKVESTNNKKVSLERYLLRSIILYSILFKITNIITISSLSMGNYIKVNNILYNIETGISFVVILSILINKEGRGLQDIICSTKVIDTSNNSDNKLIKEKVTQENNKTKNKRPLKKTN